MSYLPAYRGVLLLLVGQHPDAFRLLCAVLMLPDRLLLLPLSPRAVVVVVVVDGYDGDGDALANLGSCVCVCVCVCVLCSENAAAVLCCAVLCSLSWPRGRSCYSPPFGLAPWAFASNHTYGIGNDYNSRSSTSPVHEVRHVRRAAMQLQCRLY